MPFAVPRWSSWSFTSTIVTANEGPDRAGSRPYLESESRSVRAEAINAAEQDAETEHQQSRLRRPRQLTYLSRPGRGPSRSDCPFHSPYSGTARLWARLSMAAARHDPSFSLTYQNVGLAQHLHTAVVDSRGSMLRVEMQDPGNALIVRLEGRFTADGTEDFSL